MNTKQYIDLRKSFENDILTFLFNYYNHYQKEPVHPFYFQIAMNQFVKEYSVEGLIKHLDEKHSVNVMYGKIKGSFFIVNIYEEITTKPKSDSGDIKNS